MTTVQNWHSGIAQIKESKIIGLYLGWVVPEDGQWQPLMRLAKSDRGYEASHTVAYQRLAHKYRGMAEMVFLPTVDGKEIAYTIPDIFSVRMPRLRPDTERRCKFLGLDYPNIDRLAFIAITGGNINGDSYDICPIIEPNSYGQYQFYCVLQEVNSDIKSNLAAYSKLQYDIASNGRVVVKVASDELGLLTPYFSLLGNNITEIEIINVSDDPYLGNKILVAVISKVDLYANQCFELATGKVIV